MCKHQCTPSLFVPIFVWTRTERLGLKALGDTKNSKHRVTLTLLLGLRPAWIPVLWCIEIETHPAYMTTFIFLLFRQTRSFWRHVRGLHSQTSTWGVIVRASFSKCVCALHNETCSNPFYCLPPPIFRLREAVRALPKKTMVGMLWPSGVTWETIVAR